MLMPFSKFVYLVLIGGVSLNFITPPTLQAATPQITPANVRKSNTPPAVQLTRLEVDLSRRQVSLYRGNSRIKTYPIAVGRADWETPTGNFQVKQLLRNPKWIHPFTGKAIAGGSPDNPLGKYWIGFWTDGKNWIGFHGTPNPETVGKAASHGCLRMHNHHIQELFSYVSMGTPVNVVK